MQGAAFFIGFFLLLLFMAANSDSGGFFGDAASTSTNGVETATTRSSGTTISQGSPAASPPKQLSDQEIERRIARIYRELDTLGEELRERKLREPASPYVGQVDLRLGNARNTNPDREYVEVRANSRNSAPVTISNWYLESYVTENRAAIPDGARILPSVWSRNEAPIEIEPGDRAYLVTGEPPLRVSFHENLCTGYLSNYADFYPSLRRSCPDPEDEMERFGRIKLDDDSCYDFVERISRCEDVEPEDIEDADLSKACTFFIENTLGYNNCVDEHRYDPFFDNYGVWHVYLERDEDYWRREREIIRLMDENDRVIDVIEY